jgi:hypothetical protein
MSTATGRSLRNKSKGKGGVMDRPFEISGNEHGANRKRDDDSALHVLALFDRRAEPRPS